MEEPPSKVTKYEMESQYLEGEVMEEGQEEWLSEGILTDDDYNPGSQQTEADPSDSNMGSQDETMNTASADDSQGQLDSSGNMDSNVSNIEETLNNLENSQNNNQSAEFPEELNAFLIRKTDGKIIGGDALKKESDVDESVKQSDDDDGNDTDDLLRVLGDGDQSSKHIKKEKVEMKSEQHEDSSDDDDNYIFEGKKVKNFHVAQTVLNRATATKAVPEDDVTDCSSDEESTEKKVFTFTKTKAPSNTTPPIISTTVKPGNFTITPLQTKDQPKKKIIKKVLNVPRRSSNPIKQESTINTKPVVVKSVPKPVELKNISKQVEVKSIPKPVEVKSIPKPVEVKSIPKPVEVKSIPKPVEVKSIPKPVEVKSIPKPVEVKSIPKAVEVKNNPKHLEVKYVQRADKKRPPTARYQYVNKRIQQQGSSLLKPQTDKKEENNHKEDIEPSKDSQPKQKQGLMIPEEMDEEVPTDGDSDSEDEDMYSELPSSDSDIEDWFTLDIRGERAGDYIPLLGDTAYQLLSEEKRRVKNRLDTLKKSLSALSNSGRDVADQLKEATKTVAELDAMLKVA